MKQLLYIMIGIIFTSTSAYAKDDFQCSDPNALEAVKKTFTERAKEMFYKSPSQSVDTVNVIYSKLSTQPRWGKAFSCSLRVEIPVSQEVIDIILNEDDLMYKKDETDKIDNNIFTKTGESRDNRLNDNKIVIPSFAYDLSVLDNGKEIKVEKKTYDALSRAIYAVAWLSENAEKITTTAQEKTLESEKEQYLFFFTDVYGILEDAPEDIKSKFHASQETWVKERNKKCGNAESLETNNLSIKEKIDAYRCHNATMSEQVSSLNPNEE
ncbi:hypothetical protein ACI51Z_14685 [Pectobacterium carotovorum]|uniref:hypothetical protein n=1 Tax=Pectobacterium carotovorum TaxID=554 RepID=UPI000502E2AB|nr:hypothetical protein [Pectobacterium carotovorum]KFX00777.1 hypothetical protein JV33_05080 [Pectobacterium carotovorum subsp. carotovorum]KHS84035.1 hypothetical protein RC84_07020 [Pectobacterium carotovorum subsp. carotovorum]KML70356.1 hypothetical protein G032_08380 [Pectobacterium carotovorum subsp. carotovorum ICMP 5702]MBA0175796.1 hypothetical protein [Pectobacterium carotovorum]MBB1525845.1 hypothetical protein [Pectobacterium carotovorum subsp. carotovorum]